MIIHLVSAPDPPSSDPFVLDELLPEQRVILVASKADLGIHPLNQERLAVSVVTGKGIDTLEEKIKDILTGFFPRDFSYGINSRQAVAIEKVLTAVKRGIMGIREKWLPELISSELRYGLEAIGEVIGFISSEDILDKIFQKFCIGK
ncbi:tRNA modification GTPase [Methylacidiphilum kamchatkense]|uniref:hypothetical protein n=1 Tax=Methylacidiphilum kamchatkense TaxID=431057 RepID=UPI000A8189CD|nr:hypothetical protein [Methylacidiphilum kamchatkense]